MKLCQFFLQFVKEKWVVVLKDRNPKEYSLKYHFI